MVSPNKAQNKATQNANAALSNAENKGASTENVQMDVQNAPIVLTPAEQAQQAADRNTALQIEADRQAQFAALNPNQQQAVVVEAMADQAPQTGIAQQMQQMYQNSNQQTPLNFNVTQQNGIQQMQQRPQL